MPVRRQSVREEFPLHLTINGGDYTYLLSDNYTFSNVDPGGYEMASFTIPKDLPGVSQGMKVKLDCGTQVAWEGRVKEIQRSLGSKTLLQCEGYGVQLKEQTKAEVFVDRDLSRWTGPGVERQKSVVEAGEIEGSFEVVYDENGNPGVAVSLPGTYVGVPTIEIWYNAGDHNLISGVYLAQSAVTMPASWVMKVWAVPTNHSGFELIVTYNTTPNAALSTFPTPRQYALLTAAAPAGNVTGKTYLAYWKQIAVYGTHGLTKRGAAPSGFYTGDIVKWVAEQTEGIQPGIIEPNVGYIVPHAVYYTPVEMQQIIADMAKLVGYHWGVWESPTYLTGSAEPRLDFRAYPTSPTAYAWRRQCETLDIREDLESQFNIAVVSYAESSGEPAYVTVNVDNPILDKAGIKQRTIGLSLGTSTEAAAKAYGELTLKLFQSQARIVGTAVIKEPVQSIPDNGDTPAWLLKSGIDMFRVPDMPCADVWGVNNNLPIARVECSGGEDGITTNLEFGRGPNLIEALTAELQQRVFSGQ